MLQKKHIIVIVLFVLILSGVMFFISQKEASTFLSPRNFVNISHTIQELF